MELGGILATVPPRHCCMGNSKNKEEKIFYRLVASMQQLSEWQGWTEALELLCSQVGQDNPPRVTRLHTTRSPPSPSSQAGRAQREIFSQLGNDGWDRVRGRQCPTLYPDFLLFTWTIAWIGYLLRTPSHQTLPVSVDAVPL